MADPKQKKQAAENLTKAFSQSTPSPYEQNLLREFKAPFRGVDILGSLISQPEGWSYENLVTHPPDTEDMHKMVKAGKSVEEISEQHGITPERVKAHLRGRRKTPVPTAEQLRGLRDVKDDPVSLSHDPKLAAKQVAAQRMHDDHLGWYVQDRTLPAKPPAKPPGGFQKFLKKLPFFGTAVTAAMLPSEVYAAYDRGGEAEAAKVLAVELARMGDPGFELLYDLAVAVPEAADAIASLGASKREPQRPAGEKMY